MVVHNDIVVQSGFETYFKLWVFIQIEDINYKYRNSRSMIKSTDDSIVCTRIFKLNGNKKVIVKLYSPIQIDDLGHFQCKYVIVGLGEDIVGGAVGIDGVQALQLAMQRAGTDLYASDQAQQGRLVWEAGDVPGDLGFPVFKGFVDLVPEGASIR